MIRSILVPLDGSPFAEFALPFARAIARHGPVKVRLLTAHEPRPDLAPDIDQPAHEGESVAVRTAIQAYLDETASKLGPPNAIEVTTEIVDGQPEQVIPEAAVRHRNDLILMATHGRGAISRFWLGSAADHVIRHSPVPVLLVRPTHNTEAHEPSFARVLVGLDLSPESSLILPVATSIARLFKGHVTLLHVVEPAVGIVDGALPFPMPVDSNVVEDRRRDAEPRLAELAAAVKPGVAVEPKVVVGAPVAQAILDEAKAGGFDLIAITTHGSGGIRRLLVGSVADKVIRAADQPVLVLTDRRDDEI